MPVDKAELELAVEKVREELLRQMTQKISDIHLRMDAALMHMDERLKRLEGKELR